jgi:metallo-beta-lactamase family protein
MKIPVYVDSPLAVSATEIFRKNTELFDDDVKEQMERGDNPLEFPGLKFTRTVDESKALNASNESSIILSASGMCEVGRIKHHLKHHIWNPNDTILFVGYQAPGSLGYRIVSGEPTVKVLGEEFNVNARVEYIEGYSGHADQEGLIDFVGSFRTKMPDHIFLVHGEPGPQAELEQKLKDEFGNIDVIIPSYGEEYTLDENMAVEEKYEYPAQSQINNIDLVNKMRELEVEISDMKRALLENIRLSNTADDDMVKLNNRVNDLRKQIIDMMNKGENSNE